MEYAEKGDLRAVINKKILQDYEAIGEEVIWRWFAQIAAAVKYIHSKKIIHRDIKVENIFISGDGNIKLGDFGISKLLENSMEFAGTGVGTPYYLSPEICQGLKYNFKTDIWMLGCLLYELCTLKKPFKAESIKELIKNIIHKEPEPINTKYSENLVNLIKLMLNKQPEDRPTIDEIWMRIHISSNTDTIPPLKLIEKNKLNLNKLKIEVEDQDSTENNSPSAACGDFTPLSSCDKLNVKIKDRHQQSHSQNKRENIESKYTPNNSRMELIKIRKNMNISPMNNVKPNINPAESNKSVNICKVGGNTGKNFKSRHYRHISINISSIQSPEHNAVYQVENIEIENIEFPSPMNNPKSKLSNKGLTTQSKKDKITNIGSNFTQLESNKPIYTPTNLVNIKKISPKETLMKKDIPLSTKVGKIRNPYVEKPRCMPNCFADSDVKNKSTPKKQPEDNPIRSSLVKNFLIERYTKEKFEIMYNDILLTGKIDEKKIRVLVGDDYKIAINYLRYLAKRK